VLESSAVLYLCRAKIAKYLFSDHGYCGMSFDGLLGWDEAEDSRRFQLKSFRSGDYNRAESWSNCLTSPEHRCYSPERFSSFWSTSRRPQGRLQICGRFNTKEDF
jgi:hypothetical protein